MNGLDNKFKQGLEDTNTCVWENIEAALDAEQGKSLKVVPMWAGANGCC